MEPPDLWLSEEAWLCWLFELDPQCYFCRRRIQAVEDAVLLRTPQRLAHKYSCNDDAR